VSIEFEEESRIYSVQRGGNVKGGSVFRVFEIDDNGYSEIKQDPSVFINSIVPKDMANYFFFQGEGIGSLAAGKGGDAVRKAVRDILGFNVAENALSDIRKVKDEYRKQLQKADKSGALSRVENGISELEKELQGIQVRLKDTRDAIALYEDKLSEINEKLSNSDHQVIKSKHHERQNAESDLKAAKRRLKNALDDKKGLIKEFAHVVFAEKLTNQGLDFINEMELQGKIPAPFNQQLVIDILEAKECICGADISPGTEAFKKIQSLLKKAADPDLISRVNKSRAQFTSIKNDSKKAKARFISNIEAVAEADDAIVSLTQRVEGLSLDIQNVNLDELDNLEKERKVVNQRLSEALRDEGRYQSRMEMADKEMKALESERNGHSGFAVDVSRFKSLVDCSSKIEEVLADTLNGAETNITKTIISKVNKFLSSYVRQDYIAKIDHRFNIKLYDRNDHHVAESDGQGLLLSLTFISSLIELARERKNIKSNILTSGAIAPFVIDAPFGVLDNKYKADVAKSIPDSVGQVIFLLSSSHWEGSVEKSIREKVGAEYNMVLEVATEQEHKQSDTITILDEVYQTVRYGCETDRTIIEGVGEYV
jgi:DNA sulfur modification protein DndD